MYQADRWDDDAFAAGGVPEAGAGHAARRRQDHQGGVQAATAAKAGEKGESAQT